MDNKFKNLSEDLKDAFEERDIINNSNHKKREEAALHIRNILVCIATILFLVSLLNLDFSHLLRGIAYIFGACAYFSELLMLTDFFSKKVPRKELFMVYCFAPLYVLMGLSYLLH